MLKLMVALGATVTTAATLLAQGSGGAATRTDSISQEQMLPARVVELATSTFNDSMTRRYRGDARISAGDTVRGNVAIYRGMLTVAGHITGRVVAINSDVVMTPNGRIDRDVLVIGGVLENRTRGRIGGDARVFRTQMVLSYDADSLVADARYSAEQDWWSRYDPDAPRNRSKITVRGETYNRVEGLPIHAGPSLRIATRDFRFDLDALGIIRTAQRMRWDSENIGHNIEFGARMNRDAGVGIHASLFDVVDPVESWDLSDHEAGLATFLLHRDFRDYYGRHGGAAGLRFFIGDRHVGDDAQLTLSYGLERWRSRDVRDTWTVFRDDDAWRPNPLVHEGSVHVAQAELRVDTRNNKTSPWSGWLANIQLEQGKGDLAAPESPLAPVETRYARGMLDLRRYTRILPGSQLNLRFVYGARLGDDELPLQKRFSIGGPGSLPGFDFRRDHGGTDVGTCNRSGVPAAAGFPALCERMALFQLEMRYGVDHDLFDEEDTQFVLFFDGGRGWLVDGPGGHEDGLTYDSGTILPRLGTFRTDIGAGIDLGFAGFFIAKSLSNTDVPANFFVRLGHRF
jgi:hypothetical protein